MDDRARAVAVDRRYCLIARHSDFAVVFPDANQQAAI
jgi:hypothetical protein